MGDNEQRWLMWYSGASRDDGASSDGGSDAPAGDGGGSISGAPLAPPGLAGVAPGAGGVGVAVSSDGVTWKRGGGTVEGARGAARAEDVGLCLAPTGVDYWWTLDTCHLAVSDVQVFSNSSVSSGVGVYWMFYFGGDFSPMDPPAGLPGAEGVEGPLEGLRMRPGLAMSQVGVEGRAMAAARVYSGMGGWSMG